MEEGVILENKFANYYGIVKADKFALLRSIFLRVRGNGILRLTESGVYFKKFESALIPAPSSKKSSFRKRSTFVYITGLPDVFIPIEKIRNVELSRFWGGRVMISKTILKITYEENGEKFIFAASIFPIGSKKAEKWKNKIEELKRENERLKDSI